MGRERDNRAVATDMRPSGRSICADDIEFSFPDSGLYNYKKGVISFRRKSYRQNRKGLCSSTADILNCTALFEGFTLLPYGFKLSQTWRWLTPTINNAFLNSGYLEFEDAYKKVRTLKDFAKAVNKNFFLGQGLRSKAPSLWFRQTLVGSCPAKDQIVVENQAFIQEVMDQFIPIGVGIDVAEKT